MATLNEYVAIIADRMDRPFDEALKADIKFSFKTYRALLMAREKDHLSPVFFQFVVVPLIQVDMMDSCAAIVGCPVLRTKDLIPRPIELGGDLFKYVGTPERISSKRKIFPYVELEGYDNTKYNKYTAGMTRYSYSNGYLYILGNLRQSLLGLEGIFEDPASVPNCGDICYTDDDPFPISMEMGERILQSMLSGEYKIITDPKEVKTVEKT
ncbi:MAG: hypothetical protein JST04_00720 [Bdellovibrionales bacterium]|nr:hypothetical protein [Bdellovibrionales bacterium]